MYMSYFPKGRSQLNSWQGTTKYRIVHETRGSKMLIFSHGDVKHNTGNIANNIITMYGARWVLELSVGSLCNLYKCLCCTPETNIK